MAPFACLSDLEKSKKGNLPIYRCAPATGTGK